VKRAFVRPSLCVVLCALPIACDQEADRPMPLPSAETDATDATDAIARPATKPVLSDAEIEAKVYGVIAHQLNVKVSELKPTTHLVKDLGMDELDQVETVMELEDEFEISISDEAAKKWQMVWQVVGDVRAQVKPSIAVPRTPTTHP
jgi:acyl carrier protein